MNKHSDPCQEIQIHHVSSDDIIKKIVTSLKNQKFIKIEQTRILQKRLMTKIRMFIHSLVSTYVVISHPMMTNF